MSEGTTPPLALRSPEEREPSQKPSAHFGFTPVFLKNRFGTWGVGGGEQSCLGWPEQSRAHRSQELPGEQPGCGSSQPPALYHAPRDREAFPAAFLSP